MKPVSRIPLRIFIVAAIFLFVLTAVAQTIPRQNLHGHVPMVLSQLGAMNRLPATNRLQLSIGLPFRNTNELSAVLADIYDPSSPQYRHFLSRDEFARRFGPTEADYQKVISFMRANGFKVQNTFSNRMLVDVEGSVADVEKTFHVALNTYPHPKEKRNFFAPDTEPSLDLATPILHVSGLDNYVLPHPFVHEMPLANQTAAATPLSGSGPSGNYAGLDFRAAYAPGVTLDGTGQSVALLEFAGYFGQDITNYETAFSLPHVPLVNVLLNGISNITNNATGGGGSEVSLDIEMAIDMATNLSSVVIYYGSSGDTILNQIASDNTCKQIGASWGYGSDTDSTMQQDFQEFAAQGQSYFNASGDSDADVGSPFSPSDPPYVISVGGTTLTTSGPGGSWVSERVWNWGGGTGGSGGVSTLFSMPPWQQGVDMTAAQGSTTQRNIPDVAMTADNIYVYYNNGAKGSFGGTSCATPLWAAFTALINQQAVANGNPTVGFLNPAVYALGKSTNYNNTFRDINTGNNTSPSSPSKYYAVNGYDLCTGWGTPRGQALIDALAATGPSRAAAITWTPPAAIAGDTDVCKWGNALYACDWNNSSTTVNGVSFTASSSTTSGGANIALSGVTGGNALNTFTSASNPYNALSSAYKNILAGGDYINGTSQINVTLKNLVAGKIYAAQVWVNDARTTGNGRTEIAYGNSGGNTVTLDYNSSNASGGVGQFSIGVFTADGTNDTFSLQGNASTQINALQVRDVTGCAWNFWGGYANGNWDFTTTNWGNGQTFPATTNWFSAANIADTNFYGATIANNLITLPASGVSLGAVNFVNGAVNYTLQNSGVVGLTGNTAVNVSGSGSVTFTGTNNYTGATTVNSGTLALSGSGSIGGSSQLVLNGGIFDATALGNFTAASSQPISFAGGTLVASNLTLNGALFTNAAINQSAPFIVATNLIYGATASKVVIPSLSGFASYPVQYPLVQLSGSASGTFNLNSLTLPTGYSGFLFNNLANNSVDLVLTAGGGTVVPLAWKGNVNGNWDILTTTNWVNSTNAASAQKYQNSSAVLFSDTAAGNTNIVLQTTLQPASVTVSNNALNYAFSGGQLAGAMNLTKLGSGTLTVSSSDTFTGGTTISGGTLQLNSATAAGSGAIADSGTLNLNIGANSLSNAISGAGILNVLETSGAQTTFAGSLAGFTGTLNIPASVGVSKTAIASTDVNLNSAATVNIASGGTLYLNSESISAPINLSGYGNSENYGALRLDNGASAAGTITLLGNTALGSSVGGGMVTGSVTDGGAGYGILFEGSGTTILFNANSFSGGTILKSTTVALRNGAALGSGLVTVTNSATLCVNGNSLTNPVTIASGQTLTLYSAGTIFGVISGSGAMTASGGTVTLRATNTYTGNTTVNSGTLQIAGAGTLGSGNYTGTVSIGSGNIFEFSSSSNQTISGTVSGSGALNKDTSSASTLTLSGTVSYTGATTVSAGKLILPSTATATGAVTNKAGGKIGVNVSGTSQWKPASLTLASSCALEFNNVQNAGTTTAPILPTATLPTISGVTINVNSISGAITLGSSYPLLGNITATNGFVLGAQPSGIAGHLALGSDNATLVYNVDVNSPTDIWAGTDSRHTNYWDIATSTNWVNHALLNSPVGSYAVSDTVVFDDTANAPSPVPVLIQAAVNPASMTFNNSAKNYVVTASGNNVIGGTNTLNVNGSGAVTLAGGAHTYTGATVINSGTLQLGDGTSGHDATIYGSSGVTNNGTLIFNCYSNLTASYVINGSGLFIKQGAGAISLTSTNIFTGATTINAGTLNLSGSGSLGGGNYSANITNGALLKFSSSVNQTLSGVISGSGALVKDTFPGTLTISGANTFSGGTTINIGTLALSGSGTLGSGNITVAGGATLNASAATSFTLAAGQVLSNSAWATANLIGPISTGGGKISVSFVSGTPALIVTGGTLNFSASTTVAINNTGTALAPGTYLIIAKSGSGGVAGTLPSSVTLTGGQPAAGTPALAIVGGQLYLTVGGNSSISYTASGPFTYNGAAQGPTANFSGSTGARTSQYAGISVGYGPSASTPTNAGTYYLTNSLASDADYFGAANVQTFTINPLGINVTANATNKIYGAADPALTFVTAPAPVGGDSFTGNLSRAVGEAVGNYLIGQNTLALSANYNLNYTGANLTITPAALSITASNLTKSFGQTFVFAGTEFFASGLQFSDSITSVLLSSAGAASNAPAGSYPIVPSTAVGIGLTNYNIGYYIGALTVIAPTAVNLNIVANVDGSLTITFAGDTNSTYRVQAATDLSAPVWVDLFTNTLVGTGVGSFTETNAAANASRFYRVVSP
jgi:autotransporter-associated beta strand protein